MVASSDAVMTRFGPLNLGQHFSGPRFNIAPGRMAPIIILDKSDRILLEILWGPTSSASRSKRYFSAREESICGRGPFRQALRTRRCIIPATGFYLWPKDESRHVYHCRRKDCQLFGIAGIWTNWGAISEKESPDHLFRLIEARIESESEYKKLVALSHDWSKDLNQSIHFDDLFIAIDPHFPDSTENNQPDLFYPESETAFKGHLLSQLDAYTSELKKSLVHIDDCNLNFLKFYLDELDRVSNMPFSRTISSSNISFVMLTVQASSEFTSLIDRFPAILDPTNEPNWLDGNLTAPDHLLPLLHPYPESLMEIYRVKETVSNPNYQAPDCIEPLRTSSRVVSKKSRNKSDPKTTRLSLRKELIQTALKQIDGGILLEELRWKILREENELKIGTPLERLTRSNLNSFSRTIREHIPEIVVYKLPRPENQMVGLVAREALYRFDKWRQIHLFLGGKNPTVFCKFERRNRKKKTILFAFCSQDDLNHCIRNSVRPISTPLTLVSFDKVSIENLRIAASFPGSIVRVSGGSGISALEEQRQKFRQIGELDSVNPRWQKRKFPRTRILQMSNGGPEILEKFILR